MEIGTSGSFLFVSTRNGPCIPLQTIMFKSKGLFSGITCPYKDECVLPQCIFGHLQYVPSAQMQSIGSATISEIVPPVNEYRPGISDRRECKRRKIENNNAQVPQTAENKGPKVAQQLGGITSDVSVSLPLLPLSSELRTISPPLSHHSEARLHSNPAKASVLTDKVSDEAKSRRNFPGLRQKCPKSEPLNPRHLKTSPAAHGVRLKLVQLLHEQFMRLNTELGKEVPDAQNLLVLSTQEMITMALDVEEKAALEKPAVHSSVVKNTILRYRKMSVAEWKKERKAAVESFMAISEEVNGKTRAISPPVLKAFKTDLPPNIELAILPKLFTPIDNLAAFGYTSVIPSEDEIVKARAGITAAQGWEICDRCRTRFQVFPGRRESDGLLTSGGSCTYHWGKPFFASRSTTEVKGTKREKRYKCCGEAVGDSSGCTKAENHVFKVSEVKRLASLLDFIETPENERADEEKPICIDGEMGYTVYGLELIRITATSWPAETPILDVLVRPFGEILDLNSRWSGVTASQLANAPFLVRDPETNTYDLTQLTGTETLHVVESPAVARKLLLQFLTPRTPIIGHGLENDLNSVRLVHPTVVDTALLFPHQAGLPYRHALRTLVSSHLGRTIQAGGGLTVPAAGEAGAEDIVGGHDSKEDANAAGELVRWAVRREWERMRRLGWKMVNNRLVPPDTLSEGFLEDKPMKTELQKEIVGIKRKIDDV